MGDKISRLDRLVQAGYEYKAATSGLTAYEKQLYEAHMVRLEIIQNHTKEPKK